MKGYELESFMLTKVSLVSNDYIGDTRLTHSEFDNGESILEAKVNIN